MLCMLRGFSSERAGCPLVSQNGHTVPPEKVDVRESAHVSADLWAGLTFSQNPTRGDSGDPAQWPLLDPATGLANGLHPPIGLLYPHLRNPEAAPTTLAFLKDG